MDSIDRSLLEQAIDAASIDGDVRSYQGRMQDTECAAVSIGGEPSEMALFFVNLPGVIGEDEAQYLAKRTRIDGMGHGTILYWPRVALEGEEI